MMTHRYETGMTLVGLMVGMFISLLCILASLTLYKSIVQVAAESKIDNQYDAQIASAMMIVQKEVQSAGYGISSATTDHIKRRLTGDVLELMWRYNDGTNFICKGLKERGVAATTSDLAYRELQLIEASSGCDATAALTGLTWSATNTLGRFIMKPDTTEGLTKHITDNTTLLAITEPTAASCAAIGSTEPGNYYTLSITVPSIAKLNGATSDSNTYNYCLTNLKQP